MALDFEQTFPVKVDCQTKAHNFAAGWIRFWFPWVRLWEANSVSDPSWDLFPKGRNGKR